MTQAVFFGGGGPLGSPGSLRTPLKPNPHVGGGDRIITKKKKKPGILHWLGCGIPLWMKMEKYGGV